MSDQRPGQAVTAEIGIRHLEPHDHDWVEELMEDRWRGTTVISRGRAHDVRALPGLVAVLEGEPAGVLTYLDEGPDRQLITLDAIIEHRGVGQALLTAILDETPSTCERIWLTTTNDNVDALIFYQRAGFSLAAVHRDSMDEARRLKPTIPEVARNGVPIRDELELEIRPRE